MLILDREEKKWKGPWRIGSFKMVANWGGNNAQFENLQLSLERQTILSSRTIADYA
jgi:hypothetical protein